jgi:hypothetical protein
MNMNNVDIKMKNRSAVYYESIVPPRHWLVTASLLWDQIWIGEFGSFFSTKWDPKSFPGVETPDLAFMREIRQRSNILDENATPRRQFDGIVSPIGDTAEEYIETYSKLLQDFIDMRPVVFPERYKELNDEMPKDNASLVDLLSLLRKRLIPDWLTPGYPDFDFFFDLERKKHVKNARANQIIHGVQATIPITAASLSLDKIIDFREERFFQRRKFQDAVDDLISQFNQCSTASQLERTSKDISTFVWDRLNDLDNIYRKYRIDTTTKILGVSISAPAISNVLSSLLHVPFYTPAGILSAIAILSAAILNERSKAVSDIQKDSWAYLWNIKRIKG